MSLVKGSTPDLTPAALTALGTAIAADVVVLFGLNLSDARKAALNGLLGAAVVVGFFIHDAWLRSGRNKRLAIEATNARWKASYGSGTTTTTFTGGQAGTITYAPTKAAGVEEDDPPSDPAPRHNEPPQPE